MTESVFTNVAFRYDFGEHEMDRHFCSVISSTVGYHPGIVGVENHNKYGEEIKKHIHYHFMYPADERDTKKFIEKIRKQIQRENASMDSPRSKGYYSLTMPDVEDLERWLRYPLKQCETFKNVLRNDRIPLPPDFDLELQWKLSSEEYQRSKMFLSSRRESADRRQTTYQKILASIEEAKLIFSNSKEIFKYILQYYRDEELPVERYKVQSIVDSISLKQGIMTEDEYYEIVMRKG